MRAKPKQLTPENAARFGQPDVVARYHLRPPYPAEAFDILLSLMTDQPPIVLDVGTGTGELARSLVTRVERVDAVDVSLMMINKGKRFANGNHPNLRWIHGRVEEVPLTLPYGLIVGGESLHWLDWNVAFSRFHELTTGYVALIERGRLPVPWDDDLRALIRQVSLMQNYETYELAEELEKCGCFIPAGERTTAPIAWKQPIGDYISAFHSMSSLSVQDMRPEAVRLFDTSLRELVTPYSEDGLIPLQITAHIQWGKATATQS